MLSVFLVDRLPVESVFIGLLCCHLLFVLLKFAQILLLASLVRDTRVCVALAEFAAAAANALLRLHFESVDFVVFNYDTSVTKISDPINRAANQKQAQYRSEISTPHGLLNPPSTLSRGFGVLGFWGFGVSRKNAFKI